ncbi:MAG: hypothetical protein ACJ77K_12855 [Bacteroidia bacterium]
MTFASNIYFRISGSAKDITERFSDLLLKQGFDIKMIRDSENHIIYSRAETEFDFWWTAGTRPTLFVRKSGEAVRSDIYDKLMEKHGSKKIPLGKLSHYIYSKLDKDLYYNEHYLFISEYIKAV